MGCWHVETLWRKQRRRCRASAAFHCAKRYRYVEQAREIGHAVPVVEASVPVTFKIPGVVIDQLRAYSAASRLTLSEIVTRALETFLTAVRRRGRHG
jgi:hypothetical protein